MKPVYVKELQENQLITSTFLVQAKEIRQKKTGDPFLSLTLGDRTGEVDAKMWDNVAEVMDTFEREAFVKVKGLVQVYHNRPQLTIHKLRLVEDGEVDFKDYFPASERDPEEMFSELRATVSAMTDEHLRALLDGLLDDPEIGRRYRMAPAAKQIHHAYLGGLLEHVLSLCGLCKMAAAHYQALDLNLLLAGAVVHDIGKIHELSYERGFSYTTEGQLLGHMQIALRLIDGKLRDLPGFPAKTRMLIEHMILSHHGKLEFGSPKTPQFPEALLLHHLDDLDSKMECMRASVARDRQVDGYFTGYIPSLERSVFKKAKYLEQTDLGVKAVIESAVTEIAVDKVPADASAALPLAAVPETPRPASPAPAPPNPASPAPTPPRSTSPKPASPFAEKLLQAIGVNGGEEG